MNKKELIDLISDKSGFTKVDSEKAFTAVFETLTELLVNGDSIIIPKFASLGVKLRPARNGRNPSTGKMMEIPASKVISFKTSSKLKEVINA